MLATLRKRYEREDEGFTLIELMVVVLIIAILLAIAIPTFLGAQDRARDRAAQSNLRNGITAAKTIATDADGFFLDSGGAAIDASDLRSVEGSLTWVDGASTTNNVVSVYNDTTAPAGEFVVLSAKSASGTYFCMSAQSNGQVLYGRGAASGDVDTVAECDNAKF